MTPHTIDTRDEFDALLLSAQVECERIRRELDDVRRGLCRIDHRRLRQRLRNSVLHVRAYTWNPCTSPRLAVRTGRSPR